MQLLDEIIELLSSKDGSLSEALIKTKVLLHKIGQKDLVLWVNHELNGYPDDEQIPNYRLVDAQVKVNASNGVYQFNSHPIPLGHLEPEHRKRLETGSMPQSLAVIEKFAKTEEGTLESHIPMEAYGLLSKGLSNGYHIQRAWSEVPITSVENILMQVRSRLLDFVLELNSGLDSSGDKTNTSEALAAINPKNLFNNAIFGPNTTIVLGNSNSTNVHNNVVTNDFESLKRELEKHGILEQDISALKTAISVDSECEVVRQNQFGPKVKEWVQSMLHKAVDATWQIELGVASSLLATALNNYYGLV
ncbi:TPA: hypothetical protein ACN3ZO_003512 [Vibrio cholerae]